MIEKLRNEAERWGKEYIRLLGIVVASKKKEPYNMGVKDGIENTCLPAFMAGARYVLRSLVKKVTYDSFPRRNSWIIAICFGGESGQKYTCTCFVDENRNLKGDIFDQGDMKYWVEIDELMDYIIKDKEKNDGKDNK